APFLHGPQKSRLKPGRVQKMIHRAGESSDCLLQLGPVEFRLMECSGHSCERGFQFMRNGIQESFLQLFGLAGNLRSSTLLQCAFFVDEQRELRSESIEQFALFYRGCM